MRAPSALSGEAWEASPDNGRSRWRVGCTVEVASEAGGGFGMEDGGARFIAFSFRGCALKLSVIDWSRYDCL